MMDFSEHGLKLGSFLPSNPLSTYSISMYLVEIPYITDLEVLPVSEWFFFPA